MCFFFSSLFRGAVLLGVGELHLATRVCKLARAMRFLEDSGRLWTLFSKSFLPFLLFATLPSLLIAGLYLRSAPELWDPFV